MPRELAEMITPEARSALGEVYALLLSIGARNGDAACDQHAAAEATGGHRDAQNPERGS